MPSDSPSGSRRHFHRGRRGHDRRHGDRRSTPPIQQGQQSEPAERSHVDVEQIMREIRAKIAQRHGVELTDEQVQELAARRLESILDPRTIKPSLLEQLRRSAGARPDTVAAADRAPTPYEFEDTTLFDSPSGLTRWIRKLLNPILKLFFNPNPLIQALHIQSRLNVEAARREAERDQRQTEWNALHYEILQRVVIEISRLSLEVQGLSLKVESLAARVDFNDRRIRGIEASLHGRPAPGRDRESVPAAAVPAANAPGESPAAAATGVSEAPAGETPRRRRRRRRGRRGSGPPEAMAAGLTAPGDGSEAAEGLDVDDGEGDIEASPDVVTTGTEAIEQVDATATTPPPQPSPERVTPQLSVSDPKTREEIALEVPKTSTNEDTP